MTIKKLKRPFWLLFITGIVYVSCRKTDSCSACQTRENVENRFFNSRTTSNATVQAVQGYLKRKNERSPFLEKTVQQIGYPYWDKAVIVSVPAIAGREATDSTSVIYIPFVRDSQHFVNASLVIQTDPADTSIRYLSDWQYRLLPNSPLSLVDSSEKHALFFMAMDNFVFGRKDFIITDTLLFRTSSYRAANIHIETATGNTVTTQVMSAPAPILCINAYMNLTQCVTCPGNVSVTQCWSEYYGVGTPDVVPAGGGGGGSGGGGGGWAPGGGAANTPPEPVDTLLKRYAEVANRHRNSLSNLCETQHKERFFNIVYYNNLLDTFRVLTSASEEEVKPNYYMIGGRILKAEWHYHPKYADGTPGSWPSGGDVVKLFDKPAGHVMIVDTYDGRYALVVENAATMAQWKNISGNGPALFPEKVRNAVASDPRSYSTGAIYVNMTKEKLLAAMGSSSTCGIGLYQANSPNGTSFIKVN